MSTETPNQPEGQDGRAVDRAKSKEVDDILLRIMETDPPNIGWMESEVAHRLLHAHSGARTLMMMSLIRAGMPKEAAEEQSNLQAPLLLFDLGMRIGKEQCSIQQMRDMFGEEPPEFPTDLAGA